MKAIFIMADSFRRDHLGIYGNRWIRTPNLDRLANLSTIFDHCYVGSFPTMPNRRDIHLSHGDRGGHRFNSWTTIRSDEITMAQRLSRAGVPTMMITDVQNGATNGYNAFKGFRSYHCNRGQEGDNVWSDASVPLDFPVPPELIRYGDELYHRVLINRAHRRVEADYFAPSTYRLACEWLERNWKRDQFFLWVETFDPHEPWDPPGWYTDMYDPDYEGRVFENPPYGFYRRIGITEREKEHMAARYAGECTMVDNCVGQLLNTLEKLGLLEEVALFFTSDHGIYVGAEGDAGCICKPWFVGEDGAWLVRGAGPKGKVTYLPLRTGTMRIPLLIKMPGAMQGDRVNHIAQPWDLQPTILDLFGLSSKEPTFQGKSLLPVAQGETAERREYAFNGVNHGRGAHRQAINEDWIYACWPEGEREPWLIDLKHDPSQEQNVAADHPDVCRRMHEALASFDPVVFDGRPGPWE